MFAATTQETTQQTVVMALEMKACQLLLLTQVIMTGFIPGLLKVDPDMRLFP